MGLSPSPRRFGNCFKYIQVNWTNCQIFAGQQMNWLRPLKHWGSDHAGLLWSVTAISAAMFLLTPLLVAWLIVRLPANYFVKEKHPPLVSWQSLPVVRWGLLLLKNLAGLVLLIAGTIMLFTPGQGLLTMAMGLALIDFPGKYRVERWLITRPSVWRSVNWMRKRAGQPEVIRPEHFSMEPKS